VLEYRLIVSRDWERPVSKSPGQRSVDGAKQPPTSAFLSEQPSLAIAFQQRNRTLPSQPRNAWSPLPSIFSWKAGMRGCFAFTVSAERKFEDGELKQDAA